MISQQMYGSRSVSERYIRRALAGSFVAVIALLISLLTPVSQASAAHTCIRSNEACTSWNPTSGEPGKTKVAITGRSWPQSSEEQGSEVTWGFAPNDVVATITIHDGGFSATITVPQNAPVGKTPIGINGDFTVGRTLSFEVKPKAADPTPTPSPRPTPSKKEKKKGKEKEEGKKGEEKGNPDKCRIEVGATGIAYGVGGIFHHFAVYTDPAGNKFHYEALPEHFPTPIPPGLLTPDQGPGETSRADQVKRLSGITLNPRLVTADSGPEACGKNKGGEPIPGSGDKVTGGPHACFLGQASQVERARIPYVAWSPFPEDITNSNAYVWTILWNCGITPRSPVSPARLLAPGWGTQLPGIGGAGGGGGGAS